MTVNCEVIVRAQEAPAADGAMTETLVEVTGSCNGVDSERTLLRPRCRLDDCTERTGLMEIGAVFDSEYVMTELLMITLVKMYDSKNSV